jgi:hypothetical protein
VPGQHLPDRGLAAAGHADEREVHVAKPVTRDVSQGGASSELPVLINGNRQRYPDSGCRQR